MTCREAIQEVFADVTGVLTTNDVISRIYAKYPNQPWQRNTISAYLIGLSANHSSSHHYPAFRKHAFLFSLGNGRYRLHNSEADGTWVVTKDGVQLADESQDVIIAEEEAATDDAADGIQLSLERDLEQALLRKLDQLEPGLTLYEHSGVRGQQLDTNVVGRLDLLAEDSEARLVVIELKAGRADDRVVGQILRYMGWVQQEIAPAAGVRGVVVASDFTDRARYAAAAVPAITLMQYEVQFAFTTA